MRKLYLFGLAVVVLTAGMALAGCKEPENDPFEGTWVGTGERGSTKIVAGDGSFSSYMNDTKYFEGTYSVDGDTVTITITRVNTLMFGEADAWVNYADLDADYKDNMSSPMTMTLQGDSLLYEGEVLATKQ